MESQDNVCAVVCLIITTFLTTFPVGTEKERLGGQTPLGEQESTAQPRETGSTGWDASVGFGRALLPAL